MMEFNVESLWNERRLTEKIQLKQTNNIEDINVGWDIIKNNRGPGKSQSHTQEK